MSDEVTEFDWIDNQSGEKQYEVNSCQKKPLQRIFSFSNRQKINVHNVHIGHWLDIMNPNFF